MSRNDEEHGHMVTLAQWLDAHQLVWLHPANEGIRSPATARRLKAEGLKPGAPDVVILSPARDGRPTCLELKAPGFTGPRGRPTDTQLAFLDLARGTCNTQVCWGSGDAIDWLESLGYGKGRC
ncbi:MAG: VRR-NUC domain-containing protein [Gemmatimonadales bacterium]|jgi:hypothetical protein